MKFAAIRKRLLELATKSLYYYRYSEKPEVHALCTAGFMTSDGFGGVRTTEAGLDWLKNVEAPVVDTPRNELERALAALTDGWCNQHGQRPLSSREVRDDVARKLYDRSELAHDAFYGACRALSEVGISLIWPDYLDVFKAVARLEMGKIEVIGASLKRYEESGTADQWLAGQNADFP